MKLKNKRWLCAVCAFVFCGIMGVKYFHNPQEPVILETVSPNASIQEEQNKGALNLQVKSAVLLDADTGQVIYEQDAHKELPPASVTKVMTMLLALEAVEDGKAKLSDEITISDYAASMGGSQMYMEPGEVHTLEELLSGMAIASANDATVAVSEYIAGSEEVFVEKMNKRAEELGLRDTHFVNTNGLPVAEHYTSAYDIGKISMLLLKHPETKEWFTTWQKTITIGLPGKEKEFGLTNTNKLLKQYPGANGIKTGFTQEAGYCLSASATKEDTTLIAVALGAETAKIRNEEVTKLLNYGFANYSTVPLAEKGQKIKKLKLDKGEPYTLYAVPKEKLTAFIKKGSEKEVTSKAVINKQLKLPMKKGTPIGKLKVYQGKKKIAEYELVADCNVEKAPFTKYYIRKIKNLYNKARGKIRG